ncbi:Chalcone-flavanone isomerase family protein [Striga hermonthica]|uniref:Chalcone-flavanone isomerase family protein n=1 Tax=Striga hermonthica TaxID=68872 RepID=A0A9N7R7S8_STRHE|nr:Chalcone-flavanone isomerase family protein [Striga hermonthica]
METPSSTTRRVTRSQTMAAAAAASGTTNLLLSRKTEEAEKTGAKLKQQQDRYALIDITNDSPIVGLAMGSLRTPSSAMSKKKTARTPGSGEALLRGQVKTLLQKVEEEAELFHNRHLFSSPINLAAPTPANTPQIPNLSSLDEIVVVPQVVMSEEKKKQEERVIEAEDVVITRSLLLDFSEKSPESTEGDDDAASVWSIEVNASSNRDKDECEDECYDCVECEEDEEDDGYGDKNDDELDELCEELSKVRVDESNGGLRFTGKHIRFVYDDGDEIKREEQVFGCDGFSGVLRLKGLPTPKGKHIWFPDESEGK